ncbi:MAG TPA: prepilin-type N-terminal cleavage/methylation domain-containing protein [Terrimicrobiaceae bacterium]
MCNAARPTCKAANRGYSLIELLAVMAIISALAGLTIGSLSPVRANALTAGGNQSADLLAAARQNSLARHAFTAVVIKATGDGRFSAHCLFELTRDDDGNFTAWKMIRPWDLLPDGICFHQDSDFLQVANCVIGAQGQNLPTAANFRGSSADLTSKPDFRVQIFQPDGTLIGGKLLRLRVAEGAQDSTSGMIYTGAKDPSNNPLNYYDLVILSETGQSKIERL